MVATPGYAAPEVLTGERATVRSDVYSLAATLAAEAAAEVLKRVLASVSQAAVTAIAKDPAKFGKQAVAAREHRDQVGLTAHVLRAATVSGGPKRTEPPCKTLRLTRP